MDLSRASINYSICVFIVLVGAILLRFSAYAMLYFPWPPGTDQFIYYDMALNSSQGNGPVLDFVYSYLAIPAQITHLEDYYEPFYGLLSGALMTEPTYLNSLRLSIIASLGLLPAIFVLTNVIARRLFEQSKRVAFQSALIALCLLAVHPLFIQRSASLMKESVISLAYLLFALGIFFIWDRKGSGILIAILCFAIGTLQYESLPILFLSVSLTLILQKNWFKLSVFIATFGALNGAYWFCFYQFTGLWVSTKFYFLTSAYDGSSFAKPRPFSALALFEKCKRALSYIQFRSISVLGLPLILMGATSVMTLKHDFFKKTYLVWLLNSIGIYFLIHGIAVDLRPQDYMVLLSLGLPFIACLGGILFEKSERMKTLSFKVWIRKYFAGAALLYMLSFVFLNVSGFVQTYFFYPLWHTTQTLPLILAGLIFGAAKTNKLGGKFFDITQNYAVLCLFPLILYGFNSCLSYVEIYDNTAQELFIAEQALSIFTEHHLPNAVFLVNAPYSMHYFTNRPTLKLTDRQYIQQFQPSFSIGLSEADLIKNGFSSKLFHRIDQIEIRKINL